MFCSYFFCVVVFKEDRHKKGKNKIRTESKELKILGKQEGSVSKGIYLQAWLPEFSP